MNMAFFVHFEKARFWRKKNNFEDLIFEQQFHNVSNFELKILKRVRFWNKIVKTCHILKQKILKMSDFELKILKTRKIL